MGVSHGFAFWVPDGISPCTPGLRLPAIRYLYPINIGCDSVIQLCLIIHIMVTIRLRCMQVVITLSLSPLTAQAYEERSVV